MDTTNARGQATQETFGNGVVLTPTYQFQTGQLTGLSYSKAGSNLRQLGYGYDVFGNLTRQSLNANASREDYSYDQLHRLVQSIRSGAASGTVRYGFDAVGNLTKKSDFSSDTANAYGYTGGSCGGGANAVKSVQLAAGGTRTYCYDANGNLTGDNAGLSIAYDHQNLPYKATRGAQTDWFRYGADGMRTRSWGADGSRVYLPGYEHRTDTGETKVYVGDYAVISRTGATRKVEYLLKDRLGSVDAVANSSGTVTETRGYDAFGKPRDGSWNDLTPAKIASTAVTPKGFTQHEHLNQLELIHMNGRAYDYHLGRFTGVDPFIQFPLNSQSLNPYSYILNNPLAGTDPTGYELECTDKGACTFQGSDIDRLEVHKDGKGKVTSVVAEVDGQRIQVQSAQLKNGASTQTLNFSRQDTLDRAESTIGAAVQRSNQADGQAEYRGQDLRPHVDMRREAARVFGSASLPAAVGVCIAAMPECIALIQLGSKLKRTPEAKGGVQPATTEEMAVAMERASAERAANMRQSGSGRTADDMLSDARSARDALAKRLGELPADKRPATVTGGYNIQTGEVAARACGGGKCAEDHVVATLGGDKSVIRFTEAVRPRAINPPYKQVPVCTRCEPKYGRDSFPSGTQFKSDQQ